MHTNTGNIGPNTDLKSEILKNALCKAKRAKRLELWVGLHWFSIVLLLFCAFCFML